MMCFLDRTFCPGTNCANRQGCSRFATSQIREVAGRRGLPLALFAECHLLECFKPENEHPNEGKADE